MAFIRDLKWPESEKNFSYLSEYQASYMAKTGYRISVDPDASEYIYESSALALKSDHISANFKRKCKKFSAKYAYTVQMITQQWLQEQSYDIYEKQLSDVLYMLTHYQDYEMQGIVISYQNERAFMFGYENTHQEFTLTATDYTSEFGSAAVPVCIYEMAKRLTDVYPYINLEEDMGIEGLRRMKQLYHPVFMLEAYHADYKSV